MMDGSAVQQLYKIVEDTDLCNVYEEFLVSRFAWENFGFWFEVEVFKQEDDPEELKRLGKLIYEKFLDEGCIFELGDLDPSTRKAIANKLDDPAPSLFNGLQRKVMSSLALATISDFFMDDMYKIFQSSFVSHAPAPFKKGNSEVKLRCVPQNIKESLEPNNAVSTNLNAKGFLFSFQD